jgi:hypothetical protein
MATGLVVTGPVVMVDGTLTVLVAVVELLKAGITIAGELLVHWHRARSPLIFPYLYYTSSSPRRRAN